MKKRLFVLVSILVLAGLLVGCGPKEAEVGETVLKVTGKIGKTNSGSDYILDQAAFDAKSVEQSIDDPWMGDGQQYKGILLSELIAMVEPADDATTISLVATDGKAVDVAIADAEQWDIMLVHWAGGELLGEDLGGPVKVAFSADARETYADEQWMWWLVEAKFK